MSFLFAVGAILAMASVLWLIGLLDDGDPPHSGSVGGPFVFPCR